ncbi:MAG: glucose-1-phosphate thymidylyltransferase, partial [bacterium]
TIKVPLQGGLIDTKDIKVGSFIGDHTKTGIGTLLDTGCVIGVACNIFGGGTTPKFIPSFSWGGEAGFVENELDKVIEVARLIMERRGVKQTEADRELLKKLYELTAEERKKRK